MYSASVVGEKRSLTDVGEQCVDDSRTGRPERYTNVGTEDDEEKVPWIRRVTGGHTEPVTVERQWSGLGRSKKRRENLCLSVE